MITDMERIGDQASDIAEIIISAKMGQKMEDNPDELTAMADRSKQDGTRQCNMHMLKKIWNLPVQLWKMMMRSMIYFDEDPKIEMIQFDSVRLTSRDGRNL